MSVASGYHLNSIVNLKQKNETKKEWKKIVQKYYKSNLLREEAHEDGNLCTEFDLHDI